MQDVSSKRNLLPNLPAFRRAENPATGDSQGPSLRLVALVACFAVSILMWCGLYVLISAL
ncbi:hypothetical protein [Rhizobium sp. CC-YZS058]|uniref:hypothetical protein n=1 Tax=Rhizobium sp. CC-YZS058 TaxID=3042153 RepID=UPI002B05CD3B|nr:hypothetical protein [Rhizobium sp. CC-YZS058]MEA3533755.1 hypothetical protein [Rhizobium sp. CC-YZS058]